MEIETDDGIERKMAPVQQVSKMKTELALTAGGVVLPATMAEVVELSQFMCKAGSSIPALMRGNPGECMGVIMDAMGWGMNPFAVARQRYIVESKDGNQTGAYMSQLITAVIQKFAPIKEKVIKPIYEGEGEDLKCTIICHHVDTGEEMRYDSPRIGPRLDQAADGSKIKSPGRDYNGIWPKNSPLWVSDPRQQIWYYSIRAWGRRFTPGVLLGVYDIEEAQAMMRDITPKEREKVNLLDDPEDAPAPIHGEVIEPERKASGVGTVQGSAWNKAAEDFADTTDREHPREPPATLSAERIYMNLVKGAKACQTVSDYTAWRTDNMTAETKKLIGPELWKELGAVTADVEMEVGYL